MKHYLLFFLVSILFLVSISNGQDKSVTAEAVFSGEAATVRELPLPAYPKEAKKEGLGGRVGVAVTINSEGNVTFVDEGDGPYPICKAVATPPVLALRLAAVNAARKAKFAPSNPSGAADPQSGTIYYVFPESAGGPAGLGTIDDGFTKLGASVESTGAKIDSDKSSASVARVTTTGGKQDIVSGGVLNGKAAALDKPRYPAAARAVRAGGQVAVQVIIDENGKMYSARAVNGHPLLRKSSEISACNSTFMPTLLSGRPVKVSGIITYNYVP